MKHECPGRHCFSACIERDLCSDFFSEMAKSIPDLFSELQQSLKCTVCNQIFDNPHSLGCNHSFCK